MTRQPFIITALAALALIFGGMVAAFDAPHSLRALATAYVEAVPAQLGAPNVITGILITYRGLDTIGEVAVLFMAGAGVSLLLGKDAGPQPAPQRPEARKAPSELVSTGAEILLPLILVFGAYVIMNGHISPGGGFQGGAIVASGVMLVMLARPALLLDHGMLGMTEAGAGILYMAVGVLGLVYAGGIFDSRLLPLGELGSFVSAGTIPIVSILLGIKVGAELAVIIDQFRG